MDNNCDGTTDEGFDVDGDTFLNAKECSFGTDCDDTDESIYPEASKSHDGIDQDCDELDLTDVDGDTFDAVEAGGDDCDDNNPDVNPGADEIAKDGIDNDCKDGDSKDGDGDGYDDELEGSTDCDDTNPEIHPGHVDWFGDEIDSDCDGDDANEIELEDASITLLGDAGTQDLLGFSAHDIDGDGIDDMIVSAPFSDSYNGRVGIFYGANYATWTTDMALASADTFISGSRSPFFGFGAACGDMDGDGYDDLVVGRGEIDYVAAGYDSDFEMVVYYGTGSAWSRTLDDTDGDVTITRELGVTPNVPSVSSATFVLSTVEMGPTLYAVIAAAYTADEEGEILISRATDIEVKISIRNSPFCG